MRHLCIVIWICLLVTDSAFGQASNSSTVAGRSHQGEELACDLPGTLQMKNTAGRDGKGMCVFTAIEMSAILQGLDDFKGFRDWCAKGPGGGWPDKVDDLIARYCAFKHIPVPKYIQYQGPDVADVLKVCDQTGRMACITYGWSPRYGKSIAHMTCCAKYSGKYAVCLDNNFPGENNYEWMPLAEMDRRVKHPTGKVGWIFVWLAPSPPPVPK